MGYDPMPADQSHTFPNQIRDLIIHEKVGCGAFGTVHKITSKKDGKVYALKQVCVEKMTPKQQQQAVLEVLILRKIRNPNIIRYCNSFTENETMYIVMELAPGGDLQSLLRYLIRSRRWLSEIVVWSYFFQLLDGVLHLHDNKIIHNDIKPPNIFISSKNVAKLGDFGVSKILGPVQAKPSRVGTPLFMAPEVLQKQPDSFTRDVWALGCVLFNLVSLKPPFKTYKGILEEKPRPIPHFYSTEITNLTTKMLLKDPERRPTIKSLVRKYRYLRHRIRPPDVKIRESVLEILKVISFSEAKIQNPDIDFRKKRNPKSARRLHRDRSMYSKNRVVPKFGARPSTAPSKEFSISNIKKHTAEKAPATARLSRINSSRSVRSTTSQISVKQFRPQSARGPACRVPVNQPLHVHREPLFNLPDSPSEGHISSCKEESDQDIQQHNQMKQSESKTNLRRSFNIATHSIKRKIIRTIPLSTQRKNSMKIKPSVRDLKSATGID